MGKISTAVIVFFWITNSYGQLEQDKALHFLGGNLYGLVGAGVASQISKGNRTWTFAGSLGGSLLIGLAKEAIDQNQYNGWDNADLLATVLGGASVGVTIDIFKQKKKRKRDALYKQAIDHVELIAPLKVNTIAVQEPLSLLGISNRVRISIP
ncbi:hypothetical protein ACFQZJ_18570 [Maribacter chungangensis]|uniref:Uncharacterized protein n=1 Tax=Maribacter chungangensis TaxID=1069117 RepID=A0ABW3B8L4_9FLAO